MESKITILDSLNLLRQTKARESIKKNDKFLTKALLRTIRPNENLFEKG